MKYSAICYSRHNNITLWYLGGLLFLGLSAILGILLGSTSLKWAELSSATLQESQNQGTASCTLLLTAGETSLRISSDLLPLEEVQELAGELRESGLLH